MLPNATSNVFELVTQSRFSLLNQGVFLNAGNQMEIYQSPNAQHNLIKVVCIAFFGEAVYISSRQKANQNKELIDAKLLHKAVGLQEILTRVLEKQPEKQWEMPPYHPTHQTHTQAEKMSVKSISNVSISICTMIALLLMKCPLFLIVLHEPG